MIEENVKKILQELPDNVKLVAAAKGRSWEEILEATEAGVEIIGENFIREAKKVYPRVGKRVKWHFIGIPGKQKHDLLRRKILEMFDMIQTLDSVELAKEIDKRCARIEKVMPVLIEINSGREPQKSGVFPEQATQVVKEISTLPYLKIMGLMTMGPRFGDPENFRPYFAKTREIFDEIKRFDLPNVEMKFLSMGMTNSYQVAIQEGANMVRIGTKIFGESSNRS